jgi:tRNA pseudouridine38-40 synthase
MRIALGVEYDGTDWHGWQTQLDRKTIQDTLEQAIKEFTQHHHSTICAGRTDAGVHASGQVVHFDTDIDRPIWSWVRGLNALLPASVAVLWAQVVPDDFHARFSARSREYRYQIFYSPVRSPLHDRFATWFYQPLNVQAMELAAQCLVGTHDFSAFRSSECQAVSPVRSLHALEISSTPCPEIHPAAALLQFRFQANAFLHHMVRNLVGSIVEVGRGAQPIDWLAQVLHQGNRTLAARTFPAKGLCMVRVEYDLALGQ